MRSLRTATPRTWSARWNLTWRRIVCLLLILVLFIAGMPPFVRLDAASTWARIYHGTGSVYGQGILRMPDGDIAVTGTLEGKLLVTRMSPEGDVRWSNTYGVGGTNADKIIRAIACAPSGMLVFREGALVRLNDSGTVRWARQYNVHTVSDASHTTEFTDAVQLLDAGFASCGVTYGYRIFLCRLSADGTAICPGWIWWG